MKLAKTLIRAGFSPAEATRLEIEQRKIVSLDRAGLLRPANSQTAAMLVDGWAPDEILALRREYASDKRLDHGAYTDMSDAERDAHDNR